MNTLKFYPKKFRNKYIQLIKTAGIKMPAEKYNRKTLMYSLILTAISSTVFYFLEKNIFFSLAVFVFVNIVFYYKTSLKATARIDKMEEVFPDVISLMASNLRAGITIDRAFVMSARKEFAPLDEEILETGKEIATGSDIVSSFKALADRIDSEKISKVILLIISGLRAGGNMSDLLEQTARNIKEKEVIEKKAASTILMYVIFIFFAVAVGAPVLFALSSVLVEIIINLTASLPDLGATSSTMPFTFNEIPISVNFVIYFSLIFIFCTDLLSCFVIGLINKGDGKTGLKYFLPLIAISFSLFFIIRTTLSKLLLDIISFS